jgi:pimeloyl-ACP methyl ester carboxylesterase
MNQKRLQRTIIAAVTSAALVLAPISAAAASPPTRGSVVSATAVSKLTAAQVRDLGFGADHVRYGVSGYRLVYRTIDVHGKPTTASGLVVLPDGGPRRLPTISYEHGTRNNRGDVASVSDDNVDRGAAELFASAGYYAVAPDYLGLGVGPGTHPYMDVASEVSASVDMLRAARQFAAERHVALDDTVRVTGFSQGGAAAMATAEALQNGVDRWRLTAVAPISGPYDVQHTELPALVNHPGDGPGEIDPIEGVFYSAYWTVTQNRRHHFYRDPAEVFQQPYAGIVERLFDGNHSDEEVVNALPPTPAQLLTPAYQQRLLHPSGPLLAAMRVNDRTCRWTPRVPIRLYAADGDRDVPIANAKVCQAELGTWAPVINVGDVDHNGSGLASVPKVLDWFVMQ